MVDESGNIFEAEAEAARSDEDVIVEGSGSAVSQPSPHGSLDHEPDEDMQGISRILLYM